MTERKTYLSGPSQVQGEDEWGTLEALLLFGIHVATVLFSGIGFVAVATVFHASVLIQAICFACGAVLGLVSFSGRFWRSDEVQGLSFISLVIGVFWRSEFPWGKELPSWAWLILIGLAIGGAKIQRGPRV